MDMGFESLESGFLALFVIPNSSQLHVGIILNHKTQYIALAYFNNQHLAFTMGSLHSTQLTPFNEFQLNLDRL